jgi:hypothetical protein
VDLSPSASPAFRHGPPVTTGGGGGSSIPNYAGQSQRLAANRMLRSLEKIILTGGTLDVEALCLIPNQWVWKFQLAITVLDDGGNIMDAAVLAAIASLRHYRKPQVDMVGGEEDGGNATPVLIPSHLKEPTPFVPWKMGVVTARLRRLCPQRRRRESWHPWLIRPIEKNYCKMDPSR